MSVLTRLRRRPAEEPAGDPPRWRTVLTRVTTVLAGLLVLFVLVAPDELSRLTPGALVRIPVEALLGMALVLVLPAKAGRVAAVAVGVAVGLLAIVEIVSMGFSAVLDRPFDPVFDWFFLDAAVGFLTRSVGKVAAYGSVVAAVLLAAGLLVLTTLSVVRLSRLVVRHRERSTRVVAWLTVVWSSCALFGVQIVRDVPVAAHPYYDRFQQVRAELRDQEAFAAQANADALRDRSATLAGLRGKDVVVSFVESYGRSALEHPDLAPQISAVLDAGDQRLRAAGFASRSAYLISPTTTGGSWLAQATLLSGLWVDNQQRHDNLVTSDRVTLAGAFRQGGWRTVGVMPGITKAWPEGVFFGYDRIYTAPDLGYHGPKFAFDTVPDQFTLSVFQRSEYAAPGRGPLMAVIPLTSSHAPWTPVPRFIDWAAVGDGSSGFGGAGVPADAVLRRDAAKMRADYRRSVEYTLTTLLSYVERYGDDDLVLVFLGDHQPASVVTGGSTSRDVPITIVARDRAVLDRMAGWGWQEGLKPGSQAPVWRMDEFRDRFLSTFG